MALFLQLTVTTARVEVDDAAGSSFFESGAAVDGNQNYVANFISVYRTTNDTLIQGQGVATFTTTFFFFNTSGSGIGENLVAQGAFDPVLNGDIGSVSAASPAGFRYLGKNYQRVYGSQLVKIG